jgi:phosphoserine phosphatase RsbU/P
MRSTSITRRLTRFAFQQLIYVLVASAVVAIFWAITDQAPSLSATLIYTFVLCNFMALVLENVSIPRSWRRAPWPWFIYPASLLLTTAVAVTIATAILFFLVPPASLPPAPRAFWAFLLTAWKFPTVASMIFGGGYLSYVATRRSLEARNRQLQRTIDLSKAEQRLTAAELQRALEIQRRLLPKTIPQPGDFEIRGDWKPAKVVGGDYYDVIQLDRDKLAICIADVVGKGVSAALLMANMQASVRAFASASVTPSYVCSRINSVLCSNIAPEKFVTLFYSVLDSAAWTLQYTNAGHPLPILIDGHGQATHLENGGALLGVFPDWQYEDSEISMHPGDLLLLFTDGITEAMAPDGEEFGESRLIAAAKRSPGQSLDDLRSQILDCVGSFCNSRLDDDATLILVAAPRASSKRKVITGRRMQYTGAHT